MSIFSRKKSSLPSIVSPASAPLMPERSVDFRQVTKVTGNRHNSPNSLTLVRWTKTTSINISGSNCGGNNFKF